MTDYGTIKIPKDAYDRHNELRKAANLSWETYLERESVTIKHDLPDALMDKLDRIERAATTAEERTNTIAKELEDMRR